MWVLWDCTHNGNHYGVTHPFGDTEPLPNYVSILRKNSFICSEMKITEVVGGQAMLKSIW